MTSNITRQKDSTFVITLNIGKTEIEHEYNHVLSHLQQSYKSKGFRPGKVPLNIIKKEIDPEVVIEETLNHVISENYSDVIKKNDLKPIVQPKVKFLNPPATLDKDWQIEITGCEVPPLELKEDFRSKIKTLNAQKPELDVIIQSLLDFSTVTLPSILIEAEISQRLSQLIDQTQQAGITIQSYLKSKNTTLDLYKETLSTQISQEWTLNLAIDKIAREQKITVDQKEIDDTVLKNPNLKTNTNLVYYLLQQQKVIDYLKSL